MKKHSFELFFKNFLLLGVGPCYQKKCSMYSNCEVQNGVGVCVCPTKCSSIFKPVCGSNKKTYYNYCHLKVDSCEKKVDIAIIKKGVCSK